MQQTTESYSGLKALLWVLCALTGLAGFLVIVATGVFVGFTHVEPGSPAAAWLAFLFKGYGAIALLISYLLCVTARDPVRFVSIIDAISGTLILLVLIDLYAVMVMGFGTYYPAWGIWARIAGRLAVAVALIAMRPKNTGA